MARWLFHLSLILLVVTVSHGAELTGRDYWNSVLPNTPMPNAISELLDSDKSPQTANPDDVSVGVGPGGVGVGVGPGKQNPGVRVGVGPGGVGVSVGHGKPNPRKQNPGVRVGPGGVGVGVGPRKQNPGKGGVSVGVGHGDVGVGVGPGHPNPGKLNPEGVGVGVGSGGVSVGVGPRHQNPGKGGVSVGVGHGGVGVGVGPGHQNPGKPNPGGVGVRVGGGGVGVRVDHPWHDHPWHDHPWHHHHYSPFQYHYAASETQIHEDPNVALFFLEKDLKPSTKMTLHFTKTMQNAPKFMPRSEADKLPFSSSEFLQILENFKVPKDSSQADEMKQTLSDCESPAINGEKKYCATSLESMVDFTTSSLKTNNVSAFSTNINPPNAPKQQYEISKCWIISTNHMVACHMEPYPCAIYYCHVARSTKAYAVNMMGKDGTRVEAIAVCHTDTKSWNPKHLAFQVLNIQPGSKPVCHFLPQDHVVWTRSM